jgi:hypothetical protein
MNEHECGQQAVIGEMHGLLKTLVKQVYGNGQKGLVSTVPELSTKIETLIETTALLSTTVSALMKFENEYAGVEKHKDKEAMSSRQKMAIIVTAILGLCSMGCTLIIKFA